MHDRFEKVGLEPNMYASQWFMTLFSVGGFPIEFTVKVFDCLLVEGDKIMYWVGLQLLKQHEKEYEKCEMESFFDIYKSSIPKLQAEDFFEKALKIKITGEQVLGYT